MYFLFLNIYLLFSIMIYEGRISNIFNVVFVRVRVFIIFVKKSNEIFNLI